MVGYVDNKNLILKRLRRAEGRVRGIHRMVEKTPTASTSSPKFQRPPRRLRQWHSNCWTTI